MKIIELPPQLFPQSRTDLARQQAKMADVVATARSLDDVTNAILSDPSDQRDRIEEAAERAAVGHEDNPAERQAAMKAA